jgi:2-keto-4-pentenoate hydratase
MSTFDPAAAARFIAEAHRSRAAYQNLPDHLAPKSLADAYAAQEALAALWEPLYGPVAGLKIATTTKVMQELMGIDHPCGGMIYQRRIHASPARLDLDDFMHVVVEFELAVRVDRDLPARGRPYTAGDVREAVRDVMAAFELIEDRNAHYRSANALSLIADNAWNAGIVLGAPRRVRPDQNLDGLTGRVSINGALRAQGATDNPMAALAWLANLALERRRPIAAGMVVITGSIIPTLALARGDEVRFEIDTVGSVELSF